MFRFTRDVSIISQTAGTVIDAYGNAVSTSGTVETKGELQQIRRDEPERAGETSVTTWNLYLPIGGSLDTSDQVIIDGTTYEVVGDPWYADTGSTTVHHIEATLVKTG